MKKLIKDSKKGLIICGIASILLVLATLKTPTASAYFNMGRMLGSGIIYFIIISGVFLLVKYLVKRFRHKP